MKVDIRDGTDMHILLDEVFDFKKAEEFRQCYEKIPTDKCKNVTINFTHTRYMDSSGLGMLLNVQSYFKSFSIPVRILGANEQIKKIFSISRFDMRFTIV
jgi:HptB-dependent secretion and biofilm anti anti-sigma factor